MNFSLKNKQDSNHIRRYYIVCYLFLFKYIVFIKYSAQSLFPTMHQARTMYIYMYLLMHKLNS